MKLVTTESRADRERERERGKIGAMSFIAQYNSTVNVSVMRLA